MNFRFNCCCCCYKRATSFPQFFITVPTMYCCCCCWWCFPLVFLFIWFYFITDFSILVDDTLHSRSWMRSIFTFAFTSIFLFDAFSGLFSAMDFSRFSYSSSICGLKEFFFWSYMFLCICCIIGCFLIVCNISFYVKIHDFTHTFTTMHNLCHTSNIIGMVDISFTLPAK